MAQEIKKVTTSSTPAPRYVDPFSAMRAEMDRVFNSFLGPSFGRFPLLSRSEAEVAVVPSIDIRETESELVVEAELPGLDEKDVSVTLNEGVLTLQGEKKSMRRRSATTTSWSAVMAAFRDRSACLTVSMPTRRKQTSIRASSKSQCRRALRP